MFSDAFVRDAHEFLPILLQGAYVTIQITILALALSTLLGFVLALMRLSPYALLRYPANHVSIVFFPPANAIKITVPRAHSSGALGDSDVYGCQQHAPLLDLEIA